MNTALKNMGEKLRDLRATTKYTQRELGEILGTNQATVARIENNIADPNPILLIKYADYFDISLDWLYGRSEEPQGKLYKFETQNFRDKIANKAEWEQFVKACFEPNSTLNLKLQEAILRISGGDEDATE